MRSLLTLLTIALLATLGVSAPSPAQAQSTAPVFETQGMVTGASNVKFPHIAATGSTLHLVANINRESATYWSKQDADPTFGAGQALGLAEGQPDYSTTSISTGLDGSIYYVWVNQTTRIISLRVKRPGQDWTPTVTVGSGSFPAFPEVAVTSDGAIFVAWRNPDQPFLVRRSIDGGASWGPVIQLSEHAGVNVADFAVGPSGQVTASYMGGEGDRLQIYAATWNGSGFTRTRVTTLNGDYADPSATYTADGRLIVAWRGVATSGYTSGVFFAERQADGSFPIARLIDGTVAGRVSVDSDSASNLHMVWTAAGNGGYQLWYSVKPATGTWSSPVAASDGAGVIFNATNAVSTSASGELYANPVSEVFYGSQVYLRYYRFRSSLTNATVVSARPVLEQGAPVSRASALAVAFTDVVGAPTEVRYHWGSAPTDADAWQPYAGTMSVPAPTLADASLSACNAETLYTQVRSAAAIQTKALSTSIVLDQAVQALVTPYNDYAAPGYTNLPSAGVLVKAPNECSGITSARPVLDGATARPVTSVPYRLSIDLPAEPGRYERGVELTDGLGNTGTFTVGVTFDPIVPMASYSSPLQIAVNPMTTIEQTIRIRGATYSDDEGNKVLPWAVLVGVSREPINLTAPSGVVWQLVPLGQYVEWTDDGNGNSVIAADATINLVNQLPVEQLTPGTYYYAAALADNAGNPSEAKVAGSMTLEKITLFGHFVPMVRR